MKALVFALSLFGASAAFACVEGTRANIEYTDVNGHVKTESRVCRAGSYMTDAERAAYVRVPKNRCKEGSRYMDVTRNDNTDNNVYTSYVCRAGKWIKAN